MGVPQPQLRHLFDSSDDIPTIFPKYHHKIMTPKTSSTKDIIKTVSQFKENSPEWQTAMLHHLLTMKANGHHVEEETINEVRLKWKPINDNFLVNIEKQNKASTLNFSLR